MASINKFHHNLFYAIEKAIMHKRSNQVTGLPEYVICTYGKWIPKWSCLGLFPHQQSVIVTGLCTWIEVLSPRTEHTNNCSLHLASESRVLFQKKKLNPSYAWILLRNMTAYFVELVILILHRRILQEYPLFSQVTKNFILVDHPLVITQLYRPKKWRTQKRAKSFSLFQIIFR